MELCLINLEEYMKIRNEELSIQELKEILIQLNIEINFNESFLFLLTIIISSLNLHNP